MVWKCPPLHLPNWNNLWKWKEQMNANQLADELMVASSEMEYNHVVDDWKLLSDAAKMLRQFDLAESLIKQQQIEIEEWKRKYKDMHNLATQAMSRVHELEKEQTYE